jgi:hypothetical protein
VAPEPVPAFIDADEQYRLEQADFDGGEEDEPSE